MAEPMTSSARALRPGGRNDEVVAAAAKVFYERGYSAATIQDVADELGILKGSLYHYIKSKHDLLYAVVEGPHREALDLVERCRQIEGTVSERLEALIRGHVEMLTANHVHWTVFLNDFSALTSEQQGALREERRSFEDFLRQLLVAGCEGGEFRHDLDADRTALALLGMVNWASKWYRPGGPLGDVDAIVDAFCALALHGVRAD